eukprot:1002028-Pelagomonas_calceolata.AAC.5
MDKVGGEGIMPYPWVWVWGPTLRWRAQTPVLVSLGTPSVRSAKHKEVLGTAAGIRDKSPELIRYEMPWISSHLLLPALWLKRGKSMNQKELYCPADCGIGLDGRHYLQMSLLSFFTESRLCGNSLEPRTTYTPTVAETCLTHEQCMLLQILT